MNVESLMRELAGCDPSSEVVVRTQDGKHVLLTVAATEVIPAPDPVRGAIMIVGDIDEASS